MVNAVKKAKTIYGFFLEFMRIKKKIDSGINVITIYSKSYHDWKNVKHSRIGMI